MLYQVNSRTLDIQVLDISLRYQKSAVSDWPFLNSATLNVKVPDTSPRVPEVLYQKSAALTLNSQT